MDPKISVIGFVFFYPSPTSLVRFSFESYYCCRILSSSWTFSAAQIDFSFSKSCFRFLRAFLILYSKEGFTSLYEAFPKQMWLDDTFHLIGGRVNRPCFYAWHIELSHYLIPLPRSSASVVFQSWRFSFYVSLFQGWKHTFKWIVVMQWCRDIFSSQVVGHLQKFLTTVYFNIFATSPFFHTYR